LTPGLWESYYVTKVCVAVQGVIVLAVSFS
jgi:hypothetical protein